MQVDRCPSPAAPRALEPMSEHIRVPSPLNPLTRPHRGRNRRPAYGSSSSSDALLRFGPMTSVAGRRPPAAFAPSLWATTV